MNSHEFTIEHESLTMLELLAHDADVTIQCDGEPGIVHVRVRSTADLSELEHQLTQKATGGRLALDFPPLLAGSGLALQFGRTSITLGQGARTSLEIRVPSGTEFDVDTKTGDIAVSGPTPGITARTTTGDVAVDVCSVARVTTGTGDVTINSLLDGSLTTASGDITLRELNGPLEATTASGDIDVLITHAAPVELRTGSGDVTVRVACELPVWQDLSSATGDVDVRLSERGEPSDEQPFVRLTARTGTGDLTVLDA